MPNLLKIRGISLIGLYIRLTENSAIVGVNDKTTIDLLKEKLGVDVVVTTIGGSELVGVLAAANSNGLVVSQYVLDREMKELERFFDNINVVETNMNCFGNILCLNDYGGIVHPDANPELVSKFEEVFEVPIVPGTVGGIKTIGMAAAVSNIGGLLNPNSNEWEIKKVNKTLKIEAVTGTVNYGSDMVGTGIVANSRGYLAGEDTTGFELGVIEESLGPLALQR